MDKAVWASYYRSDSSWNPVIATYNTYEEALDDAIAAIKETEVSTEKRGFEELKEALTDANQVYLGADKEVDIRVIRCLYKKK